MHEHFNRFILFNYMDRILLSDCLKCGVTHRFLELCIPDYSSCENCKSTEFSLPRFRYEEMCTYCLELAYFEKYSDNPVCPACGFHMNEDLSEYNPISWFKDAIAEFRIGDYTGICILIGLFGAIALFIFAII